MNVNNPNFKIGIKDLTDEQLKTSLLTYEIIEGKLSKIRENASQVGCVNNSEFFENLKYDNIFSILGGRGAGKTSILLTLYKKYQKETENIMLPFVMPELIDNNESIISWLISAMETNLNQLESKIKEFGIVNKSTEYSEFCCKSRIFDRCSFNGNNNLRKKFERLKDSYYATEYRRYGSTVDYSSLKDLLAKGVDSSFNLINLFSDYWNSLVETYKKFNKEKLKLDITPLIYIFIDDADLRPQIVNELLFVIPKYLSHPNVVVFVSASHKTLTYVVKNYMFESITKKPLNLTSLMQVEYEYNGDSVRQGDGKTVKFHDLRYGREYDKIRKLSEEILRKIFPVYNRFYIKKYNRYEDKGLLQVYRTDETQCNDTIKFSEKIGKSLYDFYKKITELHKDSVLFGDNKHKETFDKKIKNFKLLSYDGSKTGKKAELSSDFYIAFLGKYSRDITSVYYALEDMLNGMIDLLDKYYKNNKTETIGTMPEKFNEAMYEITTKFIAAVVLSNHRLNMFSRLVDDMVKTQLLDWQLYINYSKVIDVFKDERFADDNKNCFEPFVEMMCLLNFVEQLIVLVVPQRRSCHGHEEIRELFELCGIKIIKYTNDIDFLFKQYYLFHSLNIIPNFDEYRREHRGSFIKGIIEHDLVKIDAEKNKINPVKWKADEISHKEWYDVLYRVLFRTYSLMPKTREYLDDLLILKDSKFLDDKYYNLRREYIDKLKNSFVYEENDFISEMFPIGDLDKEIEETTEEIPKGVMSELLYSLESAISSLVLKFKYSEKEKLVSSAESIKKLDFDLWKSINSLIKETERAGGIERSKFIGRLSVIDSVVEKIASSNPSKKEELIFYWNIVKENFDDFMQIDSECQSYKQYEQSCNGLGDVCNEYVDCYAKIIYCKVLSQNKPKEKKVNEPKDSFSWSDYNLIKSMQYIRFIELGLEEFHKLMGEKGYE